MDRTRVFSVAERVIVFDTLDEVLDRLARTALEAASPADAVTIEVVDRVAGTVAVMKGVGVSPAFLERPPLRLGEGVSGKVVLSGEPFAASDVAALPEGADLEPVRREGLRALLCAPLRRGWGVLGCITVYRRMPIPFSEQDRFLLSMFACQAAEALEQVLEVEDLRRQASVDLLTGALNKAALLEALRRQVKLAQRHGVIASVLFLDLDDFKGFNDRHGHLLGDKLLADFARLVKANCRASDVLGRFGGEEFVLIAPHTDRDGGVRLGEKLLRIVHGHPFQGRDGEVRVTFSAGVACVPEDGLVPEEVLAKADAAMYASKRAGKARVTAWSGGGGGRLEGASAP